MALVDRWSRANASVVDLQLMNDMLDQTGKINRMKCGLGSGRATGCEREVGQSQSVVHLAAAFSATGRAGVGVGARLGLLSEVGGSPVGLPRFHFSCIILGGLARC